MGLSASQARLLSITARLSDNELHSQQIANAKVRLADQTQEASREYVNSLDAQKLVYTMYDAKGNSKQVNLTPAVMYDYAEMKNQYGISNTSGQLLVSTLDAKNYKESSNVTEFIQKYGISLQKNTSYDESLQLIYGDNTALFDINNPSQYIEGNTYYDTYLNNMLETLGAKQFATIDSYNAFRNNFQNALDAVPAMVTAGNSNDGYFASYVNTLKNMPVFTGSLPDKDTFIGERPQRTDINVPITPEPYPDLFPYAQDLLSPQCWNDTGINSLVSDRTTILSSNQIWHVEHVLAQYFWGDSTSTSKLAIRPDGTAVQINRKDISERTTNTRTHEPYYGLTTGGGNGADDKNVRAVLQKSENLSLAQKFNALYYDVCAYIDYTGYQDGLTNGSLPWRPESYQPSAASISQNFYQVMKELLLAVADDIIADHTDGSGTLGDDSRWTSSLQNYIDDRAAVDERNEQAQQAQDDLNNAMYTALLAEYNHRVEQYEALEQEYENSVTAFLTSTINTWLMDVNSHLNSYRRHLNNIPEEYVINEQDPKAQWYINLWHRMNGASDENVNLVPDQNNEMVLTNQGATSGAKWKILEDNLFKSASWLQFALEQGLVTLEQVQTSDDAATDTGLVKTKWASKIFTTCTDIQFVDDETAVARAEAIYTRKLNEIEAKDKKYDNDIKKLDTEHNALQTEYESVKSVVDKNVERSFKAFS